VLLPYVAVPLRSLDPAEVAALPRAAALSRRIQQSIST